MVGLVMLLSHTVTFTCISILATLFPTSLPPQSGLHSVQKSVVIVSIDAFFVCCRRYLTKQKHSNTHWRAWKLPRATLWSYPSQQPEEKEMHLAHWPNKQLTFFNHRCHYGQLYTVYTIPQSAVFHVCMTLWYI